MFLSDTFSGPQSGCLVRERAEIEATNVWTTSDAWSRAAAPGIGMEGYAKSNENHCQKRTCGDQKARGRVPIQFGREYHILPREFVLETAVKIGSLFRPYLLRTKGVVAPSKISAAKCSFRRKCMSEKELRQPTSPKPRCGSTQFLMPIASTSRI